MEDFLLFSSGIEYIIIGERFLCANDHLKNKHNILCIKHYLKTEDKNIFSRTVVAHTPVAPQAQK